MPPGTSSSPASAWNWRNNPPRKRQPGVPPQLSDLPQERGRTGITAGPAFWLVTSGLLVQARQKAPRNRHLKHRESGVALDCSPLPKSAVDGDKLLAAAGYRDNAIAARLNL